MSDDDTLTKEKVTALVDDYNRRYVLTAVSEQVFLYWVSRSLDVPLPIFHSWFAPVIYAIIQRIEAALAGDRERAAPATHVVVLSGSEALVPLVAKVRVLRASLNEAL